MMLRILLPFFLPVILSAGELTSLQGTTVLDEAGSPWMVRQSLMQGERDTLLMGPGTRVEVLGYSKLLLRGVVRIEGSQAKPVHIHGDSSQGGWIGLHLVTGNRPFVMSHVEVEDAWRNVVTASTGMVDASVFRNNHYGLRVEDSPGLQLRSCLFQGNRHGLVLRGKAPLMDGVRIERNAFGLVLEDGSEPGKSRLAVLHNAVQDTLREDFGPSSPRQLLQSIEARF